MAYKEDDAQPYFALTIGGDLIKVPGSHEDYDAADQTAMDMNLDVMWLIPAYIADTWATYIVEEMTADKNSDDTLD